MCNGRHSLLDFQQLRNKTNVFPYMASNINEKAGVCRRVQPPWKPPNGSVTVLKLYNSLTRNKEAFIPQTGRKVLWYSCGPAVYDDSHMGHARSYISFDILRRVLKDYFNFDVCYMMNITDIDDKIIKRARQRYLMEEYAKKSQTLNETMTDTAAALESLKKKLDGEQDPDKQIMYRTMVDKVIAAIETATSAAAGDSASADNTRQVLLESAKDVLSDWLDKNHGAEVTENSIFAELPRFYEKKFTEDMDALNVLRPDILTRVSEYIPEIIHFVQKIIDRGFGYVSNGNVYFNKQKFISTPAYYYAKRVAEAYGDAKTLEEEGCKKRMTDFALWKSSKPGEPSWDSPWGKGRPGWHIECSVMASCKLGDSIDIHTGGVYLKFPHHDNELAQAEAYFNNDLWVRYFLHSGHLTISECKMSKSLKNFITIREALSKYSARQLRLMFLLYLWEDTVDYSEIMMKVAISFEKTFNEFLWTVENLSSNSEYVQTKSLAEGDYLNKRFKQCMRVVHDCLCDSVDTKRALYALRELVIVSNNYIKSMLKSKDSPLEMELLKNIALYIRDILKMFGALVDEEQIVLPSEASEKRNDEAVTNFTRQAVLLGTLCSFPFSRTENEVVCRRVQPPWQPPNGSVNIGLQLYNSLTRKKEAFIPQNGRKVLWYSCGPTVYDDFHMGHARYYISFDILRRVLKDYFNFDVCCVTNITEIDDEIVKRARQTYLMEDYKKKSQTLEETLTDTAAALESLNQKLDEEQDFYKNSVYCKMIDEVTTAMTNAKRYNSRQYLLECAKDVLSDWLDKNHGAEVTKTILPDLPRFYRKKFTKDMNALNVLHPDRLLCVSERIPQIIDFVQKIIDQGYGYESNGSVYFDTLKFSQAPGHYYAKLVPEAFVNAKTLEEGGYSRVSKEILSEKKHVADFALWKSSKPGEASWDSTWGKGRPCCDIVCSVIASYELGDYIDIHTGGVDLKFPHHDNQLAQAEAYFNNDDWVHYSLHTGQLTIPGSKMFKSQKNFVTIREALSKHSARQLRLIFLLHSWKDTLDYSDDTMKAAISYEKTVDEFLWRVENIIASKKFIYILNSPEGHNLMNEVDLFRKKVLKRLCDSVDTKGVLFDLRKLIKKCNTYMMEFWWYPEYPLLIHIYAVTKKTLKVFGVEFIHKSLWHAGYEGGDRGSIAEAAFGSPEQFMEETEERLKKHELERKRAWQNQLNEEIMKIPPTKMFLEMKAYSRFDDKGIPTHDAAGEELSKSQIKKLQKQYDQQTKKYNDYPKS